MDEFRHMISQQILKWSSEIGQHCYLCEIGLCVDCKCVILWVLLSGEIWSNYETKESKI